MKGSACQPHNPRSKAEQSTHPAIAERHPAEATNDAFVDRGDMAIDAIDLQTYQRIQHDSLSGYYQPRVSR